MCYVEGGVCVIAADYLTVSQKAAVVRLGSLPDGLRPLGPIDGRRATKMSPTSGR